MEYKWPGRKLIVSILKENFWLKQYYPRLSTIELLKKIYPSVDWTRVDFYEGLPWFTPMAAPFVSAQALPHFYSVSRYRIYLKKYDEDRAQCIADIVHEAFHVMQAMSFAKGKGFGFFRIWMICYLADFFRNGYRQNFFEIPAFDQEYRFLACCEQKGIHGISTQLNDEMVKQLALEQSLVHTISSKPENISKWLVISAALLCFIITVAKPLLDLPLGLMHLLLRKRKK